MLDDGYLLCFAGGDLPVATQEAELPGFLDNQGVVDRQMPIEEFRWRCRALAGAFFRRCELQSVAFHAEPVGKTVNPVRP